MIPEKIQQFAPALSLYRYHEIPVLQLDHAVGSAKIALQGAQLLSWKPHKGNEDILWLSEIEPFIAGNMIRGGIPLCYPWFGNAQMPIHGTARLRLWQLREYRIETDKVRLVFDLFDENNRLEAGLTMLFSEKCELIFTHHATQAAQLAFHSYFRVGEIEQIGIVQASDSGFNAITGQSENVPHMRKIQSAVDCIYRDNIDRNQILDPQLARTIEIRHHNAGEMVLWNPWQTPMSAMRPQDYRRMICVETARISRPLTQGESVAVEILCRGLN
ncbi:D-hexose-6-phosphate mutarotase [Testudinibacter sp. P80/BLE/0925]|uniref:D-hexose-6-phosphate mutarotase n=1 Tax=Testudinibacter sp. TW-1 TaxID=3417757 RepID=UPI003D368DB4